MIKSFVPKSNVLFEEEILREKLEEQSVLSCFLGFIVQSYLSRFSASLSIAGDIVQWIKTFFNWCHEFPAVLLHGITLWAVPKLFFTQTGGNHLSLVHGLLARAERCAKSFHFHARMDPHLYSLRVMHTDKRDWNLYKFFTLVVPEPLNSTEIGIQRVPEKSHGKCQ
ncbi:hypothetical protein Pelo_13916 [Pelomyxa schiedti]|nr:hypothetical protein Pelo_13916 [Pelomyxa schiedti]